MPTVTLLYFANIAEKLGKREEVRDVVDGCTPQCLRGTLKHDYKFEMFMHCRVAINEEFASDDQELKEGDVVALIPPVSGG
jgi:molybdopterin synthase sulfur carrier subunit